MYARVRSVLAGLGILSLITGGGSFRAVAQEQGPRGKPRELRAGSKVLVGDLNARPTTAEMVPIYARFVDASQAASVPTGDNPDGNTSPSKLSGSPTSRIDYIFASAQVTAGSVYVPIDAEMRLAADHYPVVADIALPGSEVGNRTAGSSGRDR